MNNLLHSKKGLLSLIVLILLALGIPIGMYLSQQQQDVRQHAAENASLVATVDDTSVTTQEVKDATNEQYNAKAITQNELNAAAEHIVEFKLLASEARKRNITISEAELSERATSLGAGASEQKSVRSQARVELLQEKLSKVLTKTRNVQSVGFWLPPDNYGGELTQQEKQTLSEQKALKDKVLAEIQQKIQGNEDPLTIAREIVTTYPLFSKIVAVNGYILDKTPDTSALSGPKLYVYESDFKSNPFLSEIFSLKAGDIKLITTDANDGGVVVKITGETNGQYASFEDWLAQNKKTRTKILKKL